MSGIETALSQKYQFQSLRRQNLIADVFVFLCFGLVGFFILKDVPSFFQAKAIMEGESKKVMGKLERVEATAHYSKRYTYSYIVNNRTYKRTTSSLYYRHQQGIQKPSKSIPIFYLQGSIKESILYEEYQAALEGFERTLLFFGLFVLLYLAFCIHKVYQLRQIQELLDGAVRFEDIEAENRHWSFRQQTRELSVPAFHFEKKTIVKS